MRTKHVVSIVFNAVEGDSRVIKTAQTALESGYQATIMGVSSNNEIIRKEIEGVPVVLLPNFVSQLDRQKLWTGASRDPRLLIGGQLRSIIPELINLKPDLIHTHDMFGLKIGAAASRAMISLGNPIPWVHDIHEFVAGLRGDAAEIHMPTCLDWEREYLRTADHLITVSDALAFEVQKRYHLTSAPTVVHNTPKSSGFTEHSNDIRTFFGLPGSVPLVVYVGGVSPLRGCETIIEAVARLEGVHLAFVSQGRYMKSLSAFADRVGIRERFHLHGYVASDKVTSFIRSADLGIHGLVHYPNGEVAMPNKMFEYLHAGLPMVVSDVASMKNFVEQHNIGQCFVAGDVDSCASAIKAVLNSRAQFAENITPTLKQLFSWEEQSKKVQEIYTQLINSEHRSVSKVELLSALDQERADKFLFEALYAQALSRQCLEKIQALSERSVEIESRISRFDSLMRNQGASIISTIRRSTTPYVILLPRKLLRLLRMTKEDGVLPTLGFLSRRMNKFLNLRVVQ